MIALGLTILAAWLLADLLTGIVHWAEDRLAGDRLPFLGKHVFAPNRLHHTQPLAFTRSGFWSRNASSIIAAAALFVVFATATTAAIGPGVPGLIRVALVTMALAGAMANQVHYWAHLPKRAPLIVQAAQSIGLMQSRMHHAVHHAEPNRTRYCALTDWFNPVLDRHRVWAKLERIVPPRWLSDG